MRGVSPRYGKYALAVIATAGLTALTARFTCLLRRELVCSAFLMRSLATLTCDLALSLLIHSREAATTVIIVIRHMLYLCYAYNVPIDMCTVPMTA